MTPSCPTVRADPAVFRADELEAFVRSTAINPPGSG
jgi:hypothetical protein